MVVNHLKLSQDRLCKLIYILAGVCGVVLAFYMAVTALVGDAASVLFSACITLLYGVIGCAVLLRRPLFKSMANTCCAMALLLAALFLRLSLFDHISGDYVSFLSIWTETMRGMTAGQALSTPIGDYNMPYLYVILLISRLPFYDLYCIKLFSVLMDVAAALAVGKLAALMTRKSLPVLLAFAAALLAPTTWLNSAYWGQCDSVYGAFALWGLYFGLSRRPRASMVMFALSLAFKLQAVFILPIVAFLLVTNRLKLRQLPLFPVVFLAAMVPALLGGRSLHDTFSIYLDQTNAYPYLSLNAPSFWSLIKNDLFYDFTAAPVLMALILTLLVLFVFLNRYKSMDTQSLMELALIFSLLIPWCLPRMHERYFYLAEVLSIVYAAAYPKRIPVAVGLLFGGFLIYGAYLFGEVPILSMRLIAAIYGGILIYLTARCHTKTTSPQVKN